MRLTEVAKTQHPKFVEKKDLTLGEWRASPFNKQHSPAEWCSQGITSLEGGPTKILGSLDVSKNKLTSLEGAPADIPGNLYTSENQLTTLATSYPIKVGRFFETHKNAITTLVGMPELTPEAGFDVSQNKLTSLKGAANEYKIFDCSFNLLSSLEGGPSIVEEYTCTDNALTSLKHAPTTTRTFDCSNNKIASLEGVPRQMGYLTMEANMLTSLQGIHKHIDEIKHTAYFNGNPIKSHVLGLLKIKGLRKVALDNYVVAEIINKHLKNGRNIFDCQAELEDGGFEEYAQL